RQAFAPFRAKIPWHTSTSKRRTRRESAGPKAVGSAGAGRVLRCKIYDVPLFVLGIRGRILLNSNFGPIHQRIPPKYWIATTLRAATGCAAHVVPAIVAETFSLALL